MKARLNLAEGDVDPNALRASYPATRFVRPERFWLEFLVTFGAGTGTRSTTFWQLPPEDFALEEVLITCESLSNNSGSNKTTVVHVEASVDGTFRPFVQSGTMANADFSGTNYQPDTKPSTFGAETNEREGVSTSIWPEQAGGGITFDAGATWPGYRNRVARGKRRILAIGGTISKSLHNADVRVRMAPSDGAATVSATFRVRILGELLSPVAAT